MTLSKTQDRALNKLKVNGGWQSAYQLQESISTLNALYNKGLVVRKQGLGSMAFPRNDIRYKAL